MSVYENCPEFMNKRFLLRRTSERDCADLLKVYSDEKAVPLFNSDNCNGDDFFYQTAERMAQAIAFWDFSYQNRYFVRWSIIDRFSEEAVGTIELFHRNANDAFAETGLLRMDLRSDYETEEMLTSLVALILTYAYDLFDCDTVSTKAVPLAHIRRTVLFRMGFEECADMLIGHDGTRYGNYLMRRLPE